MPRKPKRPCRFPGCPNLCDKGVYCREHAEYSTDRMRGNAAERGYDGKWRSARALFLIKESALRKMQRKRQTDACHHC